MKVIFFSTLILISTFCHAQQLQRKGFFGSRLDTLKQEDVKTLNLTSSKGLKITQVVGGTSKALNMLVNDVVLTVNNKSFANARELSKYMLSQTENAPINVVYVRSGKQENISGKVVGRPRETNANCDIIYESVAYKNGKLNVIINKPRKEGKLPTMLFIPGYTCSSIDALRESDPYQKIITAFSNAGYVVVRVEKSGLGDCENTPDCNATDLYAEVANFEAGLKKLKMLPYVDTNNVFIFGHSMGGVVAPAIASHNNLRGVMVYGTVLHGFAEYHEQMNRLQFQLANPEPLDYQKKCRIQAEIIHQFYKEKKSLLEISKDKEKLKELQTDWQYDGNNVIWGRNMEYWRQIEDFNMPQKWKDTKAKVLVLYGGADIQAFSKAEHEQIVYTVNYYNKGNAEMITFPETDHLFAKVGTQQKSSDLLTEAKYEELYNAFDFEVSKQSIEWANKQIAK